MFGQLDYARDSAKFHAGPVKLQYFGNHTCDKIPAKLVRREPCQSNFRLCNFLKGLYLFSSPLRLTLNT